MAEDLEKFAALCAWGRHCIVGLLKLVLEGLLDEGGVYVAEEVVEVVHQVGVVSYDGCFHFLEKLMVCEKNDPDF